MHNLIANAPVKPFTRVSFASVYVLCVFCVLVSCVHSNGIGKTCLLSAMAHYEVKDFPTYIRVMHVEQEVSGGDETVMVLCMRHTEATSNNTREGE